MSKYEEEIPKHNFSFITTGKLEFSEILSLTGQRNHNYLKIKSTKNLNSEIAPPSHNMDKVILLWKCFS